MSGTTSLSELPNKVTLETKEIGGKRQPPKMLSPKEVEEMVSHLEGGGTGLPSRDPPVNIQHIRPDPRARPEYVPPPLQQQASQRAAQRVQENDYIKEHDTVENAIKKNAEKEVKQNSLDVLYDEIQTPLFVMLLFFVFLRRRRHANILRIKRLGIQVSITKTTTWYSGREPGRIRRVIGLSAASADKLINLASFSCISIQYPPCGFLVPQRPPGTTSEPFLPLGSKREH